MVKTLLLLIIFLFASAVSGAENYVIFVHKKEQLEIIRSWARIKKIVWLAEGQRFGVISPSEGMDEKTWFKALDTLKSLPQVKELRPDRIVRPNLCVMGIFGECMPVSQENGLEAFQQKIDELRKNLDIRDDCFLAENHCPNGANPSWGPMQMGSDLAETVVDRVLEENKNKFSVLNPPNAKVGVVDSGFDVEKQTSGLQFNSMEVDKGHHLAGDDTKDAWGHGTAVAGMISGKVTGATQSSRITLYRVTTASSDTATTHQISGGLLDAAIEKACQTNDIVNVSWSDDDFENGKYSPKKEAWYDVAQQAGCLIVKSAGNQGVRSASTIAAVAFEDPMITVAANNELGDMADFSTSGIVHAPGQGVYTLLSSGATYSNATKNNQCTIGKNLIGPMDGTSFAAPAVASVAAQIISIMRAKGTLPTDPVSKVKLVKSILMASEKFPNQQRGINAYAAALMASAMTKENMTYDQDKLVAIGKTQIGGLCDHVEPRCDQILGCTKTKACTQKLREQSFICELNQSEKKFLLQSYLALFEEELAMGLFSQIDKDQFRADQSLGIIGRLWTDSLDANGRVTRFDFALKSLDRSIEMGVPQFVTFDRWKLISTSPDFVYYVQQVNESTTATKNMVWLENETSLRKIFTAMSEKDQIKYIENIDPDLPTAMSSGQLETLYLLWTHEKALKPAVRDYLKFNTGMLMFKWRIEVSVLKKEAFYQKLKDSSIWKYLDSKI